MKSCTTDHVHVSAWNDLEAIHMDDYNKVLFLFNDLAFKRNI